MLCKCRHTQTFTFPIVNGTLVLEYTRFQCWGWRLKQILPEIPKMKRNISLLHHALGKAVGTLLLWNTWSCRKCYMVAVIRFMYTYWLQATNYCTIKAMTYARSMWSCFFSHLPFLPLSLWLQTPLPLSWSFTKDKLDNLYWHLIIQQLCLHKQVDQMTRLEITSRNNNNNNIKGKITRLSFIWLL